MISGERTRDNRGAGAVPVVLSLLVLLTSTFGMERWREKFAEQYFEKLHKEIQLRDEGAYDSPPMNKAWEFVADSNSLILDGDRDPLDVILRRTSLLHDRFVAMDAAPDMLDQLKMKLDSLSSRAGALAYGAERDSLFSSACDLQYAIGLCNPLLDFDEIILVKWGAGLGGGLPQCFNYGGCTNYWAGRGDWTKESWLNHDFQKRHFFAEDPPPENKVNSGMFAVNFRGDDPKTRRLLKNAEYLGEPMNGNGKFGMTYDLSTDANTVVFWWTHGQERGCAHLFTARLDGSDSRQLTSGGFPDYDPCFLPNNRIAFLSLRGGAHVRCHGKDNPQPCGTLYSIKPDGSDLIRLSFHETSELHPSVDNDGMIVYTRWDYVDRDFNSAHHFWKCYPDGRDPRAPHGNYPYPHSMHDKTEPEDGKVDRPWAEYYIRAVPGTKGLYSALSGGHHNGSLPGTPILIDINIPDDNRMSQVRKIVPGVFQHESKYAYEFNEWPGRRYTTPYPLSPEFFLATNTEQGYTVLLDIYGNEIPIFSDAAYAYPVPLKERPAPASPPTKTWDGERAGSADHHRATIGVVNVYEADFEWPEGTKITALRIVALASRPWIAGPKNGPDLGGTSCGRLVLGTVPVEEDGSAYFEAPVNTSIHLQALDSLGMAVQGMRSATYVHKGEQLTCLGCHEDKWTATPSANPSAFQRAPSPITTEVEEALPLTYGRTAKPVFENTCIPCHEKEGKGLSRSDFEYSQAVRNGFQCISSGGGESGTHPRKGGGYRWTAGRFGARESRIGEALVKSHMDRISREDFNRVITWIDCNSMRYAACYDLEAQDAGEVVWPLLMDGVASNPTFVESDRPAPGQVSVGLDSNGPRSAGRHPNLKATVHGRRVRLSAGSFSRTAAGMLKVFDNRGRTVGVHNFAGTPSHFSFELPPGCYVAVLHYDASANLLDRMPFVVQ